MFTYLSFFILHRENTTPYLTFLGNIPKSRSIQEIRRLNKLINSAPSMAVTFCKHFVSENAVYLRTAIKRTLLRWVLRLRPQPLACTSPYPRPAPAHSSRPALALAPYQHRPPAPGLHRPCTCRETNHPLASFIRARRQWKRHIHYGKSHSETNIHK